MAAEETDRTTPRITPEYADAGNAQQAAIFSAQEGDHPKPKRTVGLRVFDAFLYPFLTNFGVFGLSVVATYLTNRGGNRNAEGKLIYGKVGEFFEKRGIWLKGKFQKLGMGENAAEMSKMVFFSFADGTVLAPIVKLFEDRREGIAEWIDNRLGTAPQDKSAYAAEPKETWGSVLAGRLGATLLVVPTAVILQKQGLNQKMFENPGLELGRRVANKPGVLRFFEKLKVPQQNIPEVFKIGLFEAFYTSLCTAGLYFISRFIARKHTWETAINPSAKTATAPVSAAADSATPANDHMPLPRTAALDGMPLPEAANDHTALPGTLTPPQIAAQLPSPANDADTPRPQVAHMQHLDRLTSPLAGQHVTA